MGIELPPELADVAARAGVAWPEADEDAMAQSAQAWRDAATSMSTLTTDADTTARAALATVDSGAGDAAAQHWSAFVEPDSGHLTATVRGLTDAADRLEHAAEQVGTAKVEIVRNLVALAQNTDAAESAAAAGQPAALAGLATAVAGTSANVANIEASLVSAVQPASGVDLADVRNPVDANPHTPPLAAGTMAGVAEVVPTVTDTVDSVGGTVTDTVQGTVDHAVPGGATGQPGADGTRPGLGLPGDVLPGGQSGADGTRPGLGLPGDVLPGDAADGTRPGLGLPGDLLPGNQSDGRPGLHLPGVGDLLPGTDPEVTGPVPIPPDRGVHPDFPSDFPDDNTPTPPRGQTAVAGFAGGPDVAAPAPANLPPAAPPVAGAPPQPGAPVFGGPGAPAPGVPGAPPPAAAGAPAPAAPVAARAPVQPVTTFRPAGLAPGSTVDAVPPADKPRTVAGPPGAPPPFKGERDPALAVFWIHMFPIGHLPVASYRPARQLPPPHAELDYAAGLRFEPGDHPEFDLVDTTPRPAEPLVTGPPRGAGDPAVAELTEGHDPLGGENERDWDRRYLVRFGSVTAQGISADGVEYNWPPSERHPEGGSAPGEAEVLDEGAELDRFGPPEGRVFAPAGTPFAQRSLPPALLTQGYRRYRVLRRLPVWRAVSAAWFAQPGGGVRYRTTHSAVELVALGYLEEIP